MDIRQRISGCLLGGAVGDSLGWDEIRRRLGPAGVTGPSRPARFTDDTQMTLFWVARILTRKPRRWARQQRTLVARAEQETGAKPLLCRTCR